MDTILLMNHIPSCFYALFTYETDSIESSSNLFNEIYDSCQKLYNFHLKKEEQTNRTQSSHTGRKSLYGLIQFDNVETINIVSYLNERNKIDNFVFVSHKDILLSASYYGVTEAVLYTNSIQYKKKTQKEFNIYLDIKLPSKLETSSLINKQLSLI